MIKNKRTRKTIAVFFLLNFLSSVVPYNAIFGQSNTPNAPEAASFEPVDATDMVNLSTGSFSYVLPLLNVPSPEGGYPLALSYHAGIAMDQEASWIGLGWNLNPGAINRNVNGFPDDYDSDLFNEYYWDKEQTIRSYQASIGMSSFDGSTIGLNLSWGSHKSLGGHINIGITELLDFKLGGEKGVSVGLNLDLLGLSNLSSSLTLGASFETGEKPEFNLKYNTNSLGLKVSSQRVSILMKQSSYSPRVTLSSSGVGLNLNIPNSTGRKSVGAAFFSSERSSKIGNYSMRSKSWRIPIMIPFGAGFLSFSFGKQEFKFYRDENNYNFVSGPLNFYKLAQNKWKAHCPRLVINNSEIREEWTKIVDTQAEANELCKKCSTDCKVSRVKDNSVHDIYELPIVEGDFSEKENLTVANPNLPNYDKYSVQAQGLSGAIAPRILENGALYGFSGNKDTENRILDYHVNDDNGSANKFKFKSRPNFYFESQISSYLRVPVPKLDVNILKGHNVKSNTTSLPRRKMASYIEYYTNNEILKDSARLKSEGFINTKATGFDRSKAIASGIGGFKITAIDGKTYHYSLPVYNHEVIHRTYGISKYFKSNQVRPEKEAYFEKNQMAPYATHWLLTAITGHDFIDVNNNGIPDKNDFGYWVDFEYGKYSEAFIWNGAYGKDFFENPKDKSVKSWVKGRKELYYLDKVKTRTHTAIFIKSKRKDGLSKVFSYGYADDKNTYVENAFTIPEQSPLKLDKIVLFKGDLRLDKSSGNNSEKEVSLFYKNGGYKRDKAKFDLLKNIIDKDDKISLSNSRIIKSIELNNNHYDLVKGTPNSSVNGRLTLRGVSFKGKKEKTVLPSYNFKYYNSEDNFDINDKDDFGYKKKNNKIWSLNEIETPEGSKIKIEYESHKFKPVLKSEFMIYSSSFYDIQNLTGNRYKITSRKEDFKLDEINISFRKGDELTIEEKQWETLNGVGRLNTCTKKTKVVVDQVVNPREIIVSAKDDIKCKAAFSGTTPISTINLYYIVKNPLTLGGIRVKRISTVSETGRYNSMKYTYGEKGNGIGFITYLPYAPELAKELPYSSELPPPQIMYDFVRTSTEISSNGKNYKNIGIENEYSFNVLKEKEEGKIKFGNFYELISNQEYGNTSSLNQLHSFKIKDNLNSIGQLLGVKTFGFKNETLNILKNTYFDKNSIPDQIGVTQESFQTYKKISSGHNVKKLGITTTRITYPSIIKSSSEEKKGQSTITEFKDLDPITGSAREVYSYSSTGVKLRKIVLKAYMKYSQMGSKVDNINNKNMLSQTAGEYSYILKNNTWKEVGAGITTWKSDWAYQLNDRKPVSTNDVWRKHKTYVWNGGVDDEGMYTNFTDFNFAKEASNTKWKKTSEVTKYNQFSQPLETKDVNGSYVSSKMGDNYSKVIATANANYNEMHYSGAEYVEGNYFDGGIKSLGHKPTTDAHTGDRIVQIDRGQHAFEVVVPSRATRKPIENRFKVSVWVKKGQENRVKIKLNADTHNFTMAEKVIAGNWVMLTGYITLPSTSNVNNTVAITSTNGIVQLDDFRLHPAVSSMTSYVYNKWDEVSYIIGANGLATKYIYDDAGRLKETWVEVVDNPAAGIKGGFKRVTTHGYNYKRNN
ncbi:hypothetical protein [Tenacibaculum sp. C7A-26P2]|uniref:hypothetical protein n=1 Tax=Tenacibaculum sp. C7A-26P2 TaxID=3447504 RepID=UPI003F851E1A